LSHMSFSPLDLALNFNHGEHREHRTKLEPLS
jgi:hypothetical protein